jgi:hypothetical protein
MIDHDLLYWLCDRLGGGARMPRLKIINKKLSVTDLVLVENIGRFSCLDFDHNGSKISFAGVGGFGKMVDFKKFPGLQSFVVSTPNRSNVGCFAIGMQFGKFNSLSSINFNASAIDSSTFQLTEPSGLWDIARGRIASLPLDSLVYWVHQEHPQVGAVILELAGSQRAAEVIQNPNSHELLMREIMLRLFYTQHESTIMAMAIATQAIRYLESIGATILPRCEEYAPEVFANLKAKDRRKMMNALLDRDTTLADQLRARKNKLNLIVKK